jgi:hypothetical protein
LTFPGRIHGEYAFFSEPGKQHSDGGQILFDGLTVGLDPGTSQKTASKPVRKQPECSGVNVGFGDLRTSGGDQLRDPRLRRVSGTKFFILMFTSGHDNPTLRAEKRWQRN